MGQMSEFDVYDLMTFIDQRSVVSSQVSTFLPRDRPSQWIDVRLDNYRMQIHQGVRDYEKSTPRGT